MGYQTVFKRYELKYMISKEQKERILDVMEPFMKRDKYGESTIRNIYFDTDDSILARHSIMKPDFKEKLRIRSYTKAEEESTVFVELKRKYDHVVYKRRVGLPEREAMSWMTGAASRPGGSGENSGSLTWTDRQMHKEIDYFLDYYRDLKPAMFISYDRQAYRAKDGISELRITFDENILCRDYDMSLTSDVYGNDILPENMILMEVKCAGGMPLWLTGILSEEHIYKTSFSKYGKAYTDTIRQNRFEGRMSPAYEKNRRRQNNYGLFSFEYL